MAEEMNVQTSSRDHKEINLERLRKQLENERYAREQAEMRAKQYEELAKEREEAKRLREEEEYSADSSIDRKFLDQRFKSWEKDIDQKIDKKAEEKARLLLEKEKQEAFLRENRDFNTIMSPEMLQKLVDLHPDVAEGILTNMPDDFNRQKHVYKTIKSLKLHVKPEDKENIESVIKKNQTSALYQPSNVAPSAYKAVGDFSKAGQEQAYAQMQELAARFGGGGVRMR